MNLTPKKFQFKFFTWISPRVHVIINFFTALLFDTVDDCKIVFGTYFFNNAFSSHDDSIKVNLIFKLFCVFFLFLLFNYINKCPTCKSPKVQWKRFNESQKMLRNTWMRLENHEKPLEMNWHCVTFWWWQKLWRKKNGIWFNVAWNLCTAW